MKKTAKILSKALLIISIVIVLTILIANLVIIIKILFKGMIAGSDEAPDTIWWGKTELYGWNGVLKYYKVWSELVFDIEIPIIIFCIIYEIVYFKIIKKKENTYKRIIERKK